MAQWMNDMFSNLKTLIYITHIVWIRCYDSVGDNLDENSIPNMSQLSVCCQLQTYRIILKPFCIPTPAIISSNHFLSPF